MLRRLFKRRPRHPKKFRWPLYFHLHAACMENDVEMARELLGLGVSANVADPGTYARPIHFAAAHGSIELIDLLLAHGADPLQTTWVPHDSDVLPSTYAKYRGRPDLAAYLKSIEENRIAAIVASGGTPPPFDPEIKEFDWGELDEWSCQSGTCPHRATPSSPRSRPPPQSPT